MSQTELREVQKLGCVVLLICVIIAALFYEYITMRLDNSNLREKKYDI